MASRLAGGPVTVGLESFAPAGSRNRCPGTMRSVSGTRFTRASCQGLTW